MSKINNIPHIVSQANPSKSIILVTQDDKTRNLSLNPAALETIRNLKGPVAVCVCVGQYRSGKSFLLSRLAANLNDSKDDAPRVFQVDHGQDSFTKGCWMNSSIGKIKIDNELVNLLFIDTEVYKYDFNMYGDCLLGGLLYN